MSLVFVLLWGVGSFSQEFQLATSLLITPIALGLAATTALVSLVAHFATKKNHSYLAALICYYLMTATAAAIIVTTGNIASPFIALWMLLSVFGGIFGFAGLGVLGVASILYMIYLLTVLHITNDHIIIFVLAFLLPLFISFISWHRRTTKTDEKDRAFKELTQELSQVSNKSEIVINAIADGVVAVDGRGIIQLINPAAQDIIGWEVQDALELDYRSVLTLLTDKDEPVTAQTDPIQRVLSTNQPVSDDTYSLQTSAGKKMNLSLLVSPAGQIGTGAIVVFRDITDALSENRQKAEFISTASHEMRTPVATIEGYLGLALNPSTATIDEKARSYLIKAHEAAQHLGRLFQDLLDISKAEDGRMKSNPSVIDVVAFLRDIVAAMMPSAEAKQLILILKPDTDTANATLAPLYYVKVDADHLREVVSNLVENAIKYTPKGDIQVDADADETHVTISIKDTGIGIPREDISHLFQKFYRVDNTDTREIGGTGLGLYLCRRLIESMDGRIWVESTYEQGSTFFIELPRLTSDKAMHELDESTGASESTMTQPKP